MNEKINHAWIPQVVKLDEIHKNERFEITRNDGYIFKDENGNVINATKIVLEKLVMTKFKKGDKIKDKNNRVWYVVQVGNRHFDISRIPNEVGYFVPMEDQSDYIEEADEHIHYLTNHDTWKQIRQAKTEARISAANCYHYLKRIGQLKAENEQLKILNRNLLHN